MKHTSKKIVKEYYEELCNLKFDNNLNEMDKFLEKHNLPKLTEEEIDDLSRTISNSSTLATSCEELTHWKRLWCWEGLGAGGEGDDREWDGWMASLTRWTWVWVNSGRWWWTGRPAMLRFMGSQRVRHDWATELNWTELNWRELSEFSVLIFVLIFIPFFFLIYILHI